MSDPDNLWKAIDYALFNTLRFAARARSTIHPSEIAAIVGLNSYRGTSLPASMARIRTRCKQMEWPDITKLYVSKSDSQASRHHLSADTSEGSVRDAVCRYPWWSIEETEPSRVADDVWHAIREGEKTLHRQGRQTRFSGARHMVATHGERKTVATSLRSPPGFGVMDEAQSLHLTFEAVVRVNAGAFPREDALLAQRRLDSANADLATIDAYWERIHGDRTANASLRTGCSDKGALRT